MNSTQGKSSSKRNLGDIGKQNAVQVPKKRRTDLDLKLDTMASTRYTNELSKERSFKRLDSGYSSIEIDEDESDVIVTNDVHSRKLSEVPDALDAKCEWSLHSQTSPVSEELKTFGKPFNDAKQSKLIRFTHPLKKGVEPEIRSDILINHAQQTDSPSGDYFCCKLATYYEPKRNYFQHLIQNVTPGGVAAQMNLCNNDELVLLNNDFVPQLTHKKVLDLFHRVPVDSHTRLSLVFRRLKGKGQYQWYLTSAILCPYDPSTKQTIEEKNFGELKDNSHTTERNVRLRCGVPDLYLDINDTCISVGPLKKDHTVDRSKNICLATKYYEDDGHPVWKSSLKGTVGRCSYIAVSMTNELHPKLEPVWYQIRMFGARISFRYQDVYLGYSSLEQNAIAKKEEQYFEIFPITDSHGYDELDSGMSSLESLDSGMSSQESLETSLSQEGSSSHGRPHLMRTRSQTRRQVSFNTELDALCI